MASSSQGQPSTSAAAVLPGSGGSWGSGMERSFSVEDIVGGIWRLGAAGMGRTDSEAAFQEFLKKIPSSSNLAAVAQGNGTTGLDPAQQLQLQQQAFLQQQAQQMQAFQDAQASAGGGIPRVPSLDLLRQQLQHLQTLQQLNMSQPSASTVAAGPVTSASGTGIGASIPLGGSQNSFTMRSPAVSSAAGLVTGVLDPSQASAHPNISLPTVSLHLSGGISSLGMHSGGLALPTLPMPSLSSMAGIPSALQGPNAAALLQMGQLQAQQQALAASQQQQQQAAAAPVQASSGGSMGHGQEPVDKDSLEKQELRRARRMLSNRESARRSRKRKQEHLSNLETEKLKLAQLKEETEKKLQAQSDEMERLRDNADRLEEENHSLREEVAALKAEIAVLREGASGTKRKDEGRFQRSGSLKHVPSAERLNKRVKPDLQSAGSPGCSPNGHAGSGQDLKAAMKETVAV